MKKRARYGAVQIELTFQTGDLPFTIEINGFHYCLLFSTCVLQRKENRNEKSL
jgi:hypothetical protein